MSDLRAQPEQKAAETEYRESSPSAASMESLRAEIDDIDAQLAGLLARRFTITEEIGKTKAKLGREIKDEAREQEVLEKISQTLAGSNSVEFILSIFKSLLKGSVEHQIATIAEYESLNSGESPFTNVCVIGVGLIGGALSRRIKTSFPNTNLFAIDCPEVLPRLHESNIFHASASFLDKTLIERASIILLACPPDQSIEVLHNLAPILTSGQAVVDLCSVKRNICQVAESIDLNGAEFIGGHPFFGTEKSGFENSAEVPLNGRTICLVPTSKSSELSIERLRLWFSSLDLRVFITDAKSHDSTVAVTSHLIQLIASSLGSVIYEELLETGKTDHLLLSGGALAGLARLMSSRPEIWAQISRQNHLEIERLLKKINREFDRLIHADAESGYGVFESTFAKAAQVRAALQDT